jgi:hypothetical protein
MDIDDDPPTDPLVRPSKYHPRAEVPPAFVSRYIVFQLDIKATIKKLTGTEDETLIHAVRNMSSCNKYVGYITEVRKKIFIQQRGSSATWISHIVENSQ